MLCLSTIFMISTGVTAQSKLIHYWHFNNHTMADSSSPTHTIGGIDADYSSIDTSKARILYAKVPLASIYYKTKIDSIYVLPADADTINARMGQPDGIALRVRNPSDSMKLMFYIPTTNYKNIKLTYASQSSSVTKGQLHQVFDYSIDSGMTWRTSGLSMPSDSAWLIYHRTTVTFPTDTTTYNNPKLIFRITFNGNDTGVKGNNRFDNVTVEGDTFIVSTPVNGVNAISAANLHYSVYPNPVGNVLNVSSEMEGVKNISIINAEGKLVATTTLSGKLLHIDVAGLPAGAYFIKVKEVDADKVESIQFIKQ